MAIDAAGHVPGPVRGGGSHVEEERPLGQPVVHLGDPQPGESRSRPERCR